MRVIRFIAFVALMCLPFMARPQTKYPVNLINGYEQKVSGTDFSYHSSIPVARESMLIRATDGTSGMEWQTSPVPPECQGDSVTFVWLAGIGSSPGFATFDLAVNGEQKFTFRADGTDAWTLIATDGSVLRFSKDMTDQHGDRFGFMFLTVPMRYLTPGRALLIKVTGNRFERTSWYMTFKFPLQSGVNFKALPALTRSSDNSRQLGVAGILHFGPPARARIYVAGKLLKDTMVYFGYNYIRVQLPLVSKTTEFSYTLVVDGNTRKGKFEMHPVREWQVNFVQHSHTDIGYTRPQTEILAEHLRYIDYALDYCDLTDSYPDEARFRWTCEASWAVDAYLKCRPEDQIARFKKRVAEGRIELTGMYFNFDDLPDEQTLAASMQALKHFKSLGLPVVTAMQNDVNGIAWCMSDYFNEMGIRYLNMGTHGHRALICFDKPTLFWWESPSGNRMLAFRAEHYMTGNTQFKIHAGDFNVFEDELLTYLTNLETKGYPYNLISIQHSGFITDNSPPSTHASEMIRQWNEKYAWPKLKTASATDFFVEMEARYGDQFQVIRGAWPDWWTDGFGASAREVAAIRTAQGDLIANTSGLTMAALQGAVFPENINHRIDATNEALLFYTEHTVGYHGSVREPFHRNTMEQRALKESYAWEASRRAKMLGEEVMGLLQGYVQRESLPTLVVFNTLNWQRSGLFRVYIDHQILPRYTAFSLVDEEGGIASAQAIEHHSDGTMWAVWAENVPAFGFKKYLLKILPVAPEVSGQALKGIPAVVENRYYTVTIDTVKGTVTGVFDKELKLQLLDPGAEYPLGQFIYERLDNRAQMESFRLDNYTREVPDSVWFEAWEQGAVWNTLRIKGNTPAAHRDGALEMELRLFNTSKRIDLVYEIEKKLVTDPEGIYIAFPFQLQKGQLAFDVQGGEMKAGIDQIPGSSNDWNAVQNYARLSSSVGQIILASPEAPLMQFGGINTGRYKAGALPASGHIYGWPMNNYWTTNFNADQHGGHIWSYSITSAPGNSPVNASRFGWGLRVPFLARVLPGDGKGDTLWQGSFLSNWPDNLLLVSAIPTSDGKSAILHVREIAGQEAVVSIRNGLNYNQITLERVDATGAPIPGKSSDLKPYESGFFRMWFRENK